MSVPKVTGGGVAPLPKPVAVPAPPTPTTTTSAVDDFVNHAQHSLQERFNAELDHPKTFGDLDLSTQRAARDQLKALLPPSNPAYRAVVALVTSDSFAQLPPAQQQALVRTVATVASSPWFGTLDAAAQRSLLGAVQAHGDPTQLNALLGSKGFAALDASTQAKVVQAFTDPQLSDGERDELSAFLAKPELTKLDPQVKNALAGAAAKSPGDTALQHKLLVVATSSAFQRLPREAQVGFFHAMEHQNDTILFEAQQAGQAALLALVASPEFKKLDAGAQARWMTALGSPDEAVRTTALGRLEHTQEVWTKSSDSPQERTDWLRRRSLALDKPDQTTNVRSPLPGASKGKPVITPSGETTAAVFFNKNGRGIDSTPRPVTAYHVKIDGQTIDVYLAKPLPEGAPSIETIAAGLAGLPAAVRSHVQQVIVDPVMGNYLQAISAKEGRPNRVFMGADAPPRGPEMTGFLSHETGHLAAADAWSDPKLQARWVAAVASDPHAVSDYATASLQEDVAETIQHYYQVKGTPAEAQMQRDMPARYAAVKELLND